MYKHLLIPLDGSELAECVLPHVEALAKGCNVNKVTFIRVVDLHNLYIGSSSYDEDLSFSPSEIEEIRLKTTDNAEKYLIQVLNRATYQEVDVQSGVLTGRTSDAIADYATEHEVDLIVIATHGRSGISRWIWGSVADKVLRSSCVPVLLVRAPGCVPGI